MSFDWEDFVELGHDLANSPPDDRLREAKLRSAVSRAYYGAFHHARKYYAGQYYREPPGAGTGKEHQLLPAALMKSTRPNERTGGLKLRRLRHHRRQADYRISPTPDEWDAARSLHLARDIIDILQA